MHSTVIKQSRQAGPVQSDRTHNNHALVLEHIIAAVMYTCMRRRGRAAEATRVQ